MNNKILKCDWDKCINTSRWEVGLSVVVHNIFMFEASGNNDIQQIFCDKHFIDLSGCGNVVEFRQIGEEKWLDFGDYDNTSILKEIVKKSYKIYTTGHFKKLNDFL